ncbi:hypothetical protein [Sphingomonas asaccharolytica]|uniref:hypothetical protein n=1 Tax=Sphingomonas asaccharolytica TaxID=40681 RepID=UPI000834D419|nr:hypothetical protein [Sphingomonas asaccharolytica]
MFDPGSILILFALALMLVSPIHATVTRPRVSVTLIAPALRDSFVPPAPAPDLAELARCTDNALASDPLIRATAAIAETYDQA